MARILTRCFAEYSRHATRAHCLDAETTGYAQSLPGKWQITSEIIAAVNVQSDPW